MKLLQDLFHFQTPFGSGLKRTTFYERLPLRYAASPANMGFHWVRQGQVTIHARELSAPVTLSCGDLIFITRGFEHDLTFGPPVTENLPRQPDTPTAVGRGTRSLLTLITGGYFFANGPSHPLIWDLPDYILIRAGDMAESPALTACLALIDTELATQDSVDDEELRAVLLHLMYRYIVSRWLDTHRLLDWWQDIVDDDAIYRIVRAVHSEPRTSWTVDALARQADMSRTTFIERFKARMGESPMHYVTRARLQRAALLLYDTRSRVEDIARLVGYQDAFGFSKAFKRHYGVSPRLYRQKGTTPEDVSGRWRASDQPLRQGRLPPGTRP